MSERKATPASMAAIPRQRREPLPQCTPPDPRDPENVKRSQKLITSDSFRRSDEDATLLQRDELRHIRLGLDYLKPELALDSLGIRSTVVLFGGTRMVEKAAAEGEVAAAQLALDNSLKNATRSPALEHALLRAQNILSKSHYYDIAREFARRISEMRALDARPQDWVITTGGGPGIMEAGNRGAWDAGRSSIGLNITLPMEQFPNAYVSTDLCFQFRYFALRKLHFLKRAKALIAFPGGFGTLDEVFDALCLIQTRKIAPMPVVLVGKQFWAKVLNVDALLTEGMIAPEDVSLIQWAETADEIFAILEAHYGLLP